LDGGSGCTGLATSSSVLELLRAWPILASELFEVGPQRETLSPLECLVVDHANLAMIQEVYRMYPDALKRQHRTTRKTALHVACQVAPHPAGVISFLVEQYPSAAGARDIDGNLPIHLAIKAACHVETIQVLLQAHPLHDLYVYFRNASFSARVLSQFLARPPTTLKNLHLDSPCFSSLEEWDFSWKNQNYISSNIQRFSIRFSEYDRAINEWVMPLLEQLASLPRLQDLSLLRSPFDIHSVNITSGNESSLTTRKTPKAPC
jgi:hypothetical protein